MFGDNSAATVPRVVSPDVSDCEPENEPAGQVVGNPVIHPGSNANDEKGTTADVHGDPESDVDNVSAIKTHLSNDEGENDGGITHRRVQFFAGASGYTTPHRELSREQADVVEQARRAMTTEQQTRVESRDTVVQRLQAQKAESSRAKRKGADPGNWGTVNIPIHEMDVDIQQAMLNESNSNVNASKGYESDNDADEESGTSSDENDSNKENEPPRILQNRLEGKSRRGETAGAENERKAAEGVRKTSKSKKLGRLPSVPASEDMESLIDRVTSHKSKSSKGHGDDQAMRPVNHITKDSALGRAFERIDEESDSEPSDSDSSSSPSDSSSSSSESSSSSSDSSSKRRKHRRKSSKRKSARRKQKRSILKPIPPEKYKIGRAHV